MMKTAILAAGVLALLLPFGAAWADTADCTPKLITSLEMIDEPDGRVAIKVTMAGGEHRMLLATSAAHSELFQPFVSTTEFRQFNLPDRKHFYRLGGVAVGYANVDALMLGTASGAAMQMLVSPGPYASDAQVVGVLGADVLANFDLDLDFKGHRVNLFSSNPCDGKQVYWAANYSQLALIADGRIATPMVLNGKTLNVDLDTLAPTLTMRFDVANTVFGLDASSPGLVPADSENGQPAYHYPFDTLTASGIDIAKPDVVLVGNPHATLCNGQVHHHLSTVSNQIIGSRCYDGGELTMGMSQLRTMHLYFAYKAHKLYFTNVKQG